MFYISYWVIPVFSGFVWLGMLLGMLLFWTVHENAEYITPMRKDQTIAYISDIGAHQMQPLFIAAGSFTVVTFTLTFVAERWFRHTGRLAHNTSMFQKILSGLSIIAALAGMIGLIILTCRNDVKHHKTHDACLAIFIGGYIISAIFICWEYQRLGIHYREHRILRISFWIKLVFIFVELAVAIAFGVLSDKEHYNGAAVCEWVVALIFTFYVWSFAIDFIPAVKSSKGTFKHQETELEAATDDAMEERNGNGYANGRPINGVHYPNGSAAYRAEAVEPARNF